MGHHPGCFPIPGQHRLGGRCSPSGERSVAGPVGLSRSTRSPRLHKMEPLTPIRVERRAVQQECHQEQIIEDDAREILAAVFGILAKKTNWRLRIARLSRGGDARTDTDKIPLFGSSLRSSPRSSAVSSDSVPRPLVLGIAAVARIAAVGGAGRCLTTAARP